jgi:hypothetical protein
MKVAYMAAMNNAVTVKPRVPADAHPKLQPKYSPEITRPTAIPQSCRVLSTGLSTWVPEDELPACMKFLRHG